MGNVLWQHPAIKLQHNLSPLAYHSYNLFSVNPNFLASSGCNSTHWWCRLQRLRKVDTSVRFSPILPRAWCNSDLPLHPSTIHTGFSSRNLSLLSLYSLSLRACFSLTGLRGFRDFLRGLESFVLSLYFCGFSLASWLRHFPRAQT